MSDFDFIHDLRYGLRMMGKAPVVMAVAAISLAFGISANTVTFSLANGFLFKSFPYENSGDDAIDTTFIVAVTATLVAVAFFATFLPALRASRVHPVRALQASEEFRGACPDAAVCMWRRL